jgi:hypothetical protein
MVITMGPFVLFHRPVAPSKIILTLPPVKALLARLLMYK